MKPVIKPELQAKFLQHLNQKRKGDEGFTLIELLVVVIIIGVLAAIALPSLLGQVNKAKQAEAKQNVGALNRAQQAYYLEYAAFASDVTQLGVGIRTQTDNYSYSLYSPSAAGYQSFVQDQAKNLKASLKSYYGFVGTTTGNTGTSEALTISLACESLQPNVAIPNLASFTTDCNTGFTTLAR